MSVKAPPTVDGPHFDLAVDMRRLLTRPTLLAQLLAERDGD